MSDDERAAAHLWDMRQAAAAAAQFVGGRTFEEYLDDLMFRSAVERQVEIIGEAARRLTKQFRTQHEEVPWAAIITQRHVLAHEYDHIKHELIWRVVTVHVPRLIEQLDALIPNLDEEAL